MLPILFYNQLDSKRVQKSYDKVLQQLANGDFKSADVCKMSNNGYYRARLNSKDRLLFTIISCKQHKYLLLLEVIEHHNYAKSRFLRGAAMPDESEMQPLEKIEDVPQDEIKELSYLNEKGSNIYALNKFISFDETQHGTYTLQPPLIVIGAAGSGKTILILEKIKQLKGSIAYISLSRYLVENASKTYYSQGYQNEDNEVEFLSFHQYLTSWQVPDGKEINFDAFEQWYKRHLQNFTIKEPYSIYEEFKGVLTGSPLHTAFLSEEEYLSLGIKQSIFSADKKKEVYTLFTKYLHWMKENNYYDTNMISFEYLQLVKPRYNYIVIDEVQDITGIQLKFILQSLNTQGNFILTGDSNQIVHPNFFSWSKIKSYLYQQGTDNKQVQILQANYRNASEVVKLSNSLLKIKNQRFGSIDKESNYLINIVSSQNGEIVLLENDSKAKSSLNNKTQHSTQYAVIVADNRAKEDARKFFKTPLIFTIQEAKGLEYDNVILLNFISSNSKQFNKIIEGVNISYTENDTLQYARPADKTDKDAEIYKFYINSFYVAITRSIKNVYLFEHEIDHPLFKLLSLKALTKPLEITEQNSGKEAWLEEAQRLQAQGKVEQAEQIRSKYLGYEYISTEQLEQIKLVALDPEKKEQEVKKERKQLFDYAIAHKQNDLVNQLSALQFNRAMLYIKEYRQDGKEYEKNCRLGRIDEVAKMIKKYGADFTTPDNNYTGLMVAIFYGQHEVADLLLRSGASINKLCSEGKLAIDYLLEGFFYTTLFKHPLYADQNMLLKYWGLIRPHSIIFTGYEGRRFTIGTNTVLGFLFVSMRSLAHTVKLRIPVKFMKPELQKFLPGCYSLNQIMECMLAIPDELLPLHKKRRAYITSLLANNDVEKERPNNRRIFSGHKGYYGIIPFLRYEES